jgi:hypothetical protein
VRLGPKLLLDRNVSRLDRIHEHPLARPSKLPCGTILVGLIISVSSLLCGCAATLQDPDRLYPVQQEMETARQHLSDFEYRYSGLMGSPDTQRLVRNDIISTRMYIIDANYSQYEANFGRQNAQLGFAADSASQGLNTAGALFVAVPTVRILSGVAGGITGIKGSYQSDLLGSKTVDIIQAQMRANRDEVAKQIIQKMGQPTSTYPLPLAYTDLETYYRAGTFASGIIKAAEVVAANAAEAQDAKDKARFITSTLATDNTMTVLRNFIRPSGKYDKARIAQLNALMAKDPAFLGANGNPWLATQLITPETAGLRALLIQKARAQGIKM